MELLLPLEIWDKILHDINDFPSAIQLAEAHPLLKKYYLETGRWKQLLQLRHVELPAQRRYPDSKVEWLTENVYIAGYPDAVVCRRISYYRVKKWQRHFIREEFFANGNLYHSRNCVYLSLPYLMSFFNQKV